MINHEMQNPFCSRFSNDDDRLSDERSEGGTAHPQPHSQAQAPAVAQPLSLCRHCNPPRDFLCLVFANYQHQSDCHT